LSRKGDVTSPWSYSRTGTAKFEVVITDESEQKTMGEAEKSVQVPAALYSKLSDMLGKTGSDSVEELVERIIRDWVSKEAAKGTRAKPSQMTAKDEKVVEDRLKSLGYM
jgi:hypothetical protein